MEKRQSYFNSKWQTRTVLDKDEDLYIEGYFAVFNQETMLTDGFFEQIDKASFDKALKNKDIRCLFNHDTNIVLGRTGNKTLELKADDKGLYGCVKINKYDTSAMNIYAMVQRGDIDGCSFGFYPIKSKIESFENGLLSTILEADTDEVSICTFPAYPQTEIQARQKDFKQHEKIIIIREKEELRKRLKKICLNN